jgi:hypothetical protein
VQFGKTRIILTQPRSLDEGDTFMAILSAVVDIGAAVSGTVLAGLAVAGVITGGVVVAAASEVIAILAAAVAIIGVLEGANERDVNRCNASPRLSR